MDKVGEVQKMTQTDYVTNQYKYTPEAAYHIEILCVNAIN